MPSGFTNNTLSARAGINRRLRRWRNGFRRAIARQYVLKSAGFRLSAIFIEERSTATRENSLRKTDTRDNNIDISSPPSHFVTQKGIPISATTDVAAVWFLFQRRRPDCIILHRQERRASPLKCYERHFFLHQRSLYIRMPDTNLLCDGRFLFAV